MTKLSATVPMPSSNKALTLSLEERQRLRDIVHESIWHGLDRGEPVFVDINDYPPPLRQKRANFVTLQRKNQLRGCIGTVNAHPPLIKGVAENAYKSAFRDPRFPPLQPAELKDLAMTISILSSPCVLSFQDEETLLSQLRPRIDGLIIEEGTHRSTFLPSVWETLPDSRVFLHELKRKAGLPSGYWSASLRVLRYTVEKI